MSVLLVIFVVAFQIVAFSRPMSPPILQVEHAFISVIYAQITQQNIPLFYAEVKNIPVKN